MKNIHIALYSAIVCISVTLLSLVIIGNSISPCDEGITITEDDKDYPLVQFAIELCEQSHLASYATGYIIGAASGLIVAVCLAIWRTNKEPGKLEGAN